MATTQELLQQRVAAAIEGAKQRNVKREIERGIQSYVHDLVLRMASKAGWIQEGPRIQPTGRRSVVMQPDRANRRRERKHNRRSKHTLRLDEVPPQEAPSEAQSGGQLLMMLLGAQGEVLGPRSRVGTDSATCAESAEAVSPTYSQMQSSSRIDASALATSPTGQRPPPTTAPRGVCSPQREAAEPLNLQALLNKAGLGNDASGEDLAMKDLAMKGTPTGCKAGFGQHQTSYAQSAAPTSLQEALQSDKSQLHAASWSKSRLCAPPATAKHNQPPAHVLGQARKDPYPEWPRWHQTAKPADETAGWHRERGRKGNKQKERREKCFEDLWDSPRKPGEQAPNGDADLPEFFRDSKAPPFRGITLEAPVAKPPAQSCVIRNEADDLLNDSLVGGYLNALLNEDDEEDDFLPKPLQKPVVVFQ
mmetsp:Transcript_15507/g.34728  ORF Transcript_15507/g.34728 Transcript_15507/m.34728 type:complete len:420 (-) Transcript_15507:153-1412(-)